MIENGTAEMTLRVKVTTPEGVVAHDTITLEYRETNPYEMYIILRDNRRWMFARDIFRDGMRTGVGGMMDVHAWNDGVDTMFIKLSSPDGEATLSFPLVKARQFLAEMRQLVPFGKEEMNMDLVIARIFSDETRWGGC